MLAIAKLERNTIIDRTQSSKEIARLRDNYKEGRSKKYTNEKLNNAVSLLKIHSYQEAIKITNISKTRIIRARK